MSLTVGRYTFSAWLRKGIGRTIAQEDNLGSGAPSVPERATVPVSVLVNTQEVSKNFALVSPGDVIGLLAQMVVRTEPPQNSITDAEPNYLAFVEFYDEDFLWRFTPARAAGDRLRPWLALLVLEEGTTADDGEFTKDDRRLPLPVVTVKSTASLPPHGQTWAWAHVHANEGYADAGEFERFLQSLHAPDHPNADRIVCRLMSPRRLARNRAYRAFVVPAFETGRRAGLGQDTAGVDAQAPAWTAAPGSVDFPVYYEWRFRTGENEDFEELVKRLQPRPVDARVGIRGMDGEKPGWGMTAGTDLGPILPATEKQTVVGLEGALRSPQTRPRPLAVDTAGPFFQQLEDILNFPERLRVDPATAGTPVVAPPIYGEHHALRHEVETTGGGWLNQLNRDPRSRVPAGFGVKVVQTHQESYVARAWTQVHRILEANRLIGVAAWAMTASQAIHDNLAARLGAAERLVFFAPVLRKVRGSPTTLQHQLTESTLPPAAVSGAMRRLVRPRGPVARRLAGGGAFSHAALVEEMAAGRLTAAPPKPVPGDLATDARTGERLPASRLPGWLRWLVRNRLWLLLAVLFLLLLLGLATGAWIAVAVAALVAVGAFFAAGRLARRIEAAAALTRPETVAGVLERTPPRPGFRFSENDPVVPPSPRAGTELGTAPGATSEGSGAVRFTRVTQRTPAPSGGDTLEARNFRRAAVALNRRLTLRPAETRRTTFDLDNADRKLAAAVDPRRAFPLQLAAAVRFPFAPGWLLQPEHLVPAMAYPDIEDPMYEKLRDLSPELLLPNLELIPPNTLTLLVTNPAFIEAYMVGLNYEFGKELLWREYPTDRRGSYFRQFWDVKGIIAAGDDEKPEELAERSKDITRLHEWPSVSALGTHRNPKRPAGEQLVLCVRGDLLKKYPNTLIYAQKAHVARGSGGRPAPDREPVIVEVETAEDMAREIRFPVFRAAVEPDIRFFGFDLSVAQARGAEDPRLETDDWGWYFIIHQLPGEPRFGMDVTYSPDDDPTTPITWDDLAWTRFPDDLAFIDTTVLPTGFTPAGPGESRSQWGTHSARMASILFQKPVMIAVHAREMLEEETP